MSIHMISRASRFELDAFHQYSNPLATPKKKHIKKGDGKETNTDSIFELIVKTVLSIEVCIIFFLGHQNKLNSPTLLKGFYSLFIA